MLVALDIQDIVLIDKLQLTLSKGLTIVTGETGAGKSVLLDALLLTLGQRADYSLIRSGCDKGSVTAVFEPTDKTCFELLAEQDIETNDQIIVRRLLTKDKKSRAFVNDTPVTTAFLDKLAPYLMEIHGQFDDFAFFQSATHRQMLDEFAGHTDLLSNVEKCWGHWQILEKEKLRQQQELDQSRRQEDYLRHVLKELESLAPADGEEEQLSEMRTRMIAIEKNAGTLQDLVATLNGTGGESPDSMIYQALRQMTALTPLLGEETANKVSEAFQQSLDLFEQGRTLLENIASNLDFEPHVLEQAEERLFALRAAARKHHTTVGGLVSLYQDLKTQVFNLEHAEECLEQAEKQCQQAKQLFHEKASILTKSRQQFAVQFSEYVQKEIISLHLDKAQFRCVLQPCEPCESGEEKIIFEVSTNPQTPFAPLQKIASGGEISRFLLAIKVVLAEKRPHVTLIFDEIDKGIGGPTADVVGKHLHRLGTAGQVIVITHSPQVASSGDYHIHLQKTTAPNGTVLSQATILTPDGRVSELARMLAGETVTVEAEMAARVLLKMN